VTVFIGDFSHYDDRITVDVAKRIRADGIVAVSHKISEGTGGYDAEAGEAFASFRDAGFDLIGAYAVPRTGDGREQARVAIARADAIAPWWRSYPGWFWQVDLERWGYDNVSAQDGREMADELATTGKRVVVYASHGQYGNQLAGWPYPLWNADYATSRQAGYRDLYPGDSWTPLHGSGSGAWRGGWTPYSGQTPTFLQYASSATIGGLTTSDVSAYRGTLDQLRALLTGRAVTPSSTGADMELNTQIPGSGYGSKPETLDVRLALIDLTKALDPYDTSAWQNEQLRNTRTLLAGQAAAEKRDAAFAAALQALAAGGTSVDTAAVIAHIDQATTLETTAMAALHDELTAARAEVAELRAKLAAAAQAEAGALAQ